MLQKPLAIHNQPKCQVKDKLATKFIWWGDIFHNGHKFGVCKDTAGVLRVILHVCSQRYLSRYCSLSLALLSKCDMRAIKKEANFQTQLLYSHSTKNKFFVCGLARLHSEPFTESQQSISKEDRNYSKNSWIISHTSEDFHFIWFSTTSDPLI